MQCIIMEKHYNQINTPWWNKEKGSWLTDHKSELKKTSSWATVGPATDKHQTPTHRLKLYVRAVIESEAWRLMNIFEKYCILIPEP